MAVAANQYAIMNTTAFEHRYSSTARTTLTPTSWTEVMGSFSNVLSSTSYRVNSSLADLYYDLNNSRHLFQLGSSTNSVSMSGTGFSANIGACAQNITNTTWVASAGNTVSSVSLTATTAQMTRVGSTRTQFLLLENDQITLRNGTNAYLTFGGGNSASISGGPVKADFGAAGTAFYLNNLPLYFDSLQSGTGTNLVISAGNIVYRLTSSMRYKKDVSTLEVDSSKIYDLTAKSFTYKSSDERTFGLIAEDVETVLPEIVFKNKDGEPDSLNYNVLPILILEEMKKLKTRINTLEEEINLLKGKI
jgi:hypothetical protein